MLKNASLYVYHSNFQSTLRIVFIEHPGIICDPLWENWLIDTNYWNGDI